MKPRTNGYTMVLDKGLGPHALEDLMATAADYIDFLKFSFGTSAFYDEEILRKKIEIATDAGVDVYPGGTFLEVTVCQDCYANYLERAKELGCTAIEVSDGTMKMTEELRADCIKRAQDAGFKVLTEVGKKSPDDKIAIPEMQRLIAHDVELGAIQVIIEAREAGRGVGVFDKAGDVDEGEVSLITEGVDDLNKVMWEAPLKKQQQYLILRFGNNVNLGNVPTTDVLALESLRQGLRG
ncbi:MAG: phosphosulfolactate synthase, partial [Anaerolineae bacterium]